MPPRPGGQAVPKCVPAALGGGPDSNPVEPVGLTLSKGSSFGVVFTPLRSEFIRLARVTPMTLGRKIWIALGALSAVVVVFLSWRVPEPESPRTAPAQRIDNLSHMKAVPRELVAPPPNYGAR